ncbi:MAG: rhomboid family intramembrane serine protease [Bacteroidales bacterium]|nr:rhomboid family intramembrane serine protease [Bacteroidales bacterium]
MQSFFSRIPPVVKNLLIINVIMWAVPMFVPSLGRSLENLLALHYFSSPGFNPAQLFTYMFLHSGFMHLFMNMFALVMFGAPIEWAMGARRFLFYYITCGIVAALVQMGVFAIMIDKYHTIFTDAEFNEVINRGWSLMKQGYNFTDPTLGTLNALVNTPMVGASGAVYGVILALGMLFPNQPIYIMFVPIPIKAKWIVIAYAVIELSSGLGNMVDNVAHFAHLGGMIAGVALILYWKKKGVFNNHWFF